MTQLLTTIQVQAAVIRLVSDYGSPDQLTAELGNLDSAIAAAVRLVDDMRDAAGMELGAVTFAPAITDLAALLRQVVAERALILTSLGVTVEVDAPERLLTWCDPHRIERAIAWLLDNAVRHCRDAENGRAPRVRLRLWEQDAVVWCDVQNNGSGMLPPKVAALNDRLYRIGQGDLMVEGSPFGLNYVARIIHNSAGTLDVASGRDGTTLTFCLPAAPPDEESTAG